MYLRLFLTVFFLQTCTFNSLYVDNNIYDYVSMWDLGTHPEWSLRAVVAVIVWQLDLQLPMQSEPIITDVVSLNLDQGEVYNIM